MIESLAMACPEAKPKDPLRKTDAKAAYLEEA
jgi:hypothetical protein